MGMKTQRTKTGVLVRMLALLLATMAAEPAFAMEPEYPPPTAENLSGEWAGYWRGKPLGLIVLFTLHLDAKLRGTIVRNTGSGIAATYDIDETTVTSGLVRVRAHDRERPKVEAVLEGTGGVWNSDGWLDVTFTDYRNDHLVFRFRLEKTPDSLVRKLQGMLSKARVARRTGK